MYAAAGAENWSEATMKRVLLIAIVLFCLAGLTLAAYYVLMGNVPAFSPSEEQADASVLGGRDAAWAWPVQAEGLPNFHRVSDTLYRGAQPPSAEGFRRLEEMGIKTVVNLRSSHSDRDMIRGTGLVYESIGMKAWHPEDEDVVRFLKIVTDPACQPVFVHCQHGADRTGTMCAVYRIVVQGWDKEEAIRETRYGGFGFHEIWTGLPKYIRKLDIQTIRDKTNLPE